MEKDWHELVSQPQHKVKVEKDIPVVMHDGIRLAADIYYPDGSGKFPALLSYSCYTKDVQKLPVSRYPSYDRMGNGGIESGDTEYFVSRGYAHVIADARGTGLSEGGYRFFSKSEQQDGYELIEWIANQPWCNGNVGMLGMSYFGMIQYLVAALNPPHLKAIFPYEAATDIYRQWAYHGGILNYGMPFQWWPHVPAHTIEPLDVPSYALEQRIREAKSNEDVRSWPIVYLTLMVPQKNTQLFDFAIHPHDGPYYWERSAYTKFDQIRIPAYLLSRWNCWPLHLPGAFDAYLSLNVPKKLMIMIPEGGSSPVRPWNEHHDIILRWYDHWLKGVDTGIMSEPPIKILVQGTNEWRHENEWPLARTKWTKFYLRERGVLSQTPPAHSEPVDSFSNKPALWPGEKVPSLQYTTAPFSEEVEITGPIVLYLYASLSTEDTNWITEIFDIDTDESKRLITMGWLKASHRELNEAKSHPYQPWHPHTRSIPVEPGKIYQYAIDLKETSNVFKAGHRLQLLIKGQDAAWEGPGPGRGQEYFRGNNCHLNNAKETKHQLYHTPEFQSYLSLPLVPR